MKTLSPLSRLMSVGRCQATILDKSMFFQITDYRAPKGNLRATFEGGIFGLPNGHWCDLIR